MKQNKAKKVVNKQTNLRLIERPRESNDNEVLPDVQQRGLPRLSRVLVEVVIVAHRPSPLLIFTTKAVALHSFPSAFSNSIISSIVHLLHQRLQAVEALLEAVPPEVAPGEAVPVQRAVQSKLVLVAVKSWSWS